MENPSELDDLALVRQIQHGNEAAMDQFYIRFSPGLYSFIKHQVRESTDIEDILAETMTAAVTAIMRFKGESHVFSWLCKIAKYKTIDFYRTNRSKSTLPWDSLNSEPLVAPSDLEDNLLIWQVLYHLKQDHRNVLKAKYIEGYSVREIAAQTGRSEKAIDSILVRAREAFAKEYRRLVPELEV